MVILFSGCVQKESVRLIEEVQQEMTEGSKSSIVSNNYDYPKIASWLSKKEELTGSNKPFDLVMTGWVTPEEAVKFKANNPDVLILAGLSLNTYFTYDVGPRDHGQAWWFDEYDVRLGKPLGKYYKKDNAYWREFEKGIVVSSPNSDTAINFDKEYTDISTNKKSASFIVDKGDGRIFIE